jgi:glycosyltransferase involved in cell wall biosynthesis
MADTVKTKNVLYIVDALTTGGAQTALFNVINNLDRDQYSPYVLALFKDGRVGDKLRGCAVPIECLHMERPFNIANFLRYYAFLVDLVKERDIQLIHSFLTASAIYGGVVARRVGICSILNVHTVLSQKKIVGKGRIKYLELLARSLNKILIAGNELTLRELMHLRIWRNKKNMWMIYNGIDPAGECRAQIFGQKSIRLTMVANFFPEKDHILLIKAYEILKENYPIALTFIAEGDTPYKAKVMAYVESRQLTEIVFKTSRDHDTYTHQTDIFVLTTHSEGDPIVLKEAMSVGIPVIASRVGAVNEVISDGIDGLLVEDDDIEGLVHALTRLIEGAELREGIARQAIEKYRRKFTLDQMQQEYYLLYSSIFY